MNYKMILLIMNKRVLIVYFALMGGRCTSFFNKKINSSLAQVKSIRVYVYKNE